MNSQSTISAPRVKNRTIRWVRRPSEDGPGLIVITEDGKPTEYSAIVEPFEAGVIFTLGHYTPVKGKKNEYTWKEYQTRIDPTGNTCTCPGFERWGHCKHVEGIPVLVAHDSQAPYGKFSRTGDGTEESIDLPPICKRCKGKGRIISRSGYTTVVCPGCDGKGRW